MLLVARPGCIIEPDDRLRLANEHFKDSDVIGEKPRRMSCPAVAGNGYRPNSR